MKYIHLVIYIVFGMLGILNASSQTVTQSTDKDQYVEGRIRIKVKEEYLLQSGQLKTASASQDSKLLGITAIDDLGSAMGIIKIDRVFPFSIKHESKHREYNLHLWYELAFDPSIDPNNVVEQYSILEEVDFAKPVYKKISLQDDRKPVTFKVGDLVGPRREVSNNPYSLKSATDEVSDFNDPLLKDQWHYENDGEMGTEDQDIDLFQAWSKSTGDSSIVVAIVDGGIDTKHEDLSDAMWINYAEQNGEEGVDDDGNGYVDDIYGVNFVLGGNITAEEHGTHVAGTVGAVSNNGIGVAGVAGGNGKDAGVKLMSCQVFDSRSSNSGNFAAAIVYGADNGAIISQNSWGYNVADYYEPEVYDAIKYFIAEAGQYEGSPMQGGILFFASGNTGIEESHYPGTFEEVVAVASSGPDGMAAVYSTFGDWVDITAPGGDQFVWEYEGGVLSTFPGNEYGYLQGTSMACPHVSGVAALVIDHFGGDDFTAEECKNIILGTTSPLVFDGDGKFGAGYLNAATALAENERIAPDAVDDLRAKEIYHNAVELEWTIPRDSDNFQPSVIYLALSEQEITNETYDDATIFSFNTGFDAGTEVSVTVNSLSKQTNYWFAMKTADVFGNVSLLSNVVKVQTTNEPFFNISTTSIVDTIDVSDGAIQKVPITLFNEGEGIITWETYVLNEQIYFEIEEEIEEELEEEEALAESHPEMFVQTQSMSLSMQANNALKSTSTTVPQDLPDHFYLDNTVASSGISYANDEAAVDLIGSGNQNAGMVLATRYFVDHDYTFNLSHIQMALYPDVQDEPIILELKKGSKNVQDAERVYLQEFYVDTVDVYEQFTMPLYEAQRFEDGELFWVVLHFPKENMYPMAVQLQDWMTDIFQVSSDNGRTFTDMQIANNKPYVPMVNILSSGEDGAYVFLDPGSGEIKAGEEQTVEVILDATNIVNGDHVASVTMVTNDVSKPYVNLEVLLNIKGHFSDLDLEKPFEFNEYNSANVLSEIQLENKGYGTLEIYDISSSTGTFSKVGADTLMLYKDLETTLEFNYTPKGLGKQTEVIELITNEGNIPVNLIYFIEEAALAEASLSENEISLAYEQSGELTINIKNTGTESNLEYNLDRYDGLNISKGIMSNTLDYAVETSNETGGPEANQWEDILNIGTTLAINDETIEADTLVATMDLPAYQFELGFEMPYFNETFEEIYLSTTGNLYFYQSDYYARELPYYNSAHKGVLSPLFAEKVNARINRATYYSYGDRMVMDLDLVIVGYDISDSTNVEYEGSIDIPYQYQVVLYRNGSIEYRYKNVEKVISEWGGYVTAIVGLDPEDYVAYRNLSETEKKVSDGMVIRFNPLTDRSYISSVSKQSGSINPGSEEDITLRFNNINPSPVAGSYSQELFIDMNTSSGHDVIPFTINITGTPDFTSQDTLNFEETKLGATNLQVLKIDNEGSDLGTVNSISFEDEEFTTAISFPLSINAKANSFIPVVFEPTAVGTKTTTATVVYSTGLSETITLISSALRNPEFSHNLPSSIEVNLIGGAQTNIEFDITTQNTGTKLDVLGISGLYTKLANDDLQSATGVTNETINKLYGYSWSVGDSTRIYHKWNDISDDYELLKVDASYQEPVELPFDFPFYGEVYDTVWVSVNGYVSVIEPTTDDFNLEFLEDNGIAGMIAPFFASLKAPSDKDGIKMRKETDRVYLQWDNYLGSDPNGTGGAISFQLELLKDGRIYFHYKDVEQWGGLFNYGLEHPDESELLEHYQTWILSWSDIQDSTTIAIMPPLVSDINSGDSETYKVNINADNIYRSGTYNDTLLIKTNSWTTPEIEVPIILNVTGEPELICTDALKWEKVIYAPEKTISKTLVIENKGYDVLEITSIADNDIRGFVLYDQGGEELIRLSSGALRNEIEINPWESVELQIEIDASSIEAINGNLVFETNAGTKNVDINANFVTSPAFAWDASDQSYEVNNTQVETYTFNISNTGDTDLEFKVFPAVVPSGDAANDSISDLIGSIDLERGEVIDSLYHDNPNNVDGMFEPFVGGTRLMFCNEFEAPENGFFITHVQVFNYLHSSVIDEYSQIFITVGGEEPFDGKKVCDQKFIVDKAIDQEWTYYQLENPVSIPAGEKFYVIVTNPLTPSTLRNIGFTATKDADILEYSWIGGYYGVDDYTLMQSKDDGINMIWKIRPLTAAGEGQWVSLDVTEGELSKGEETTIVATIETKGLESGKYSSKLITKSNDVNNLSTSVNIDINVNGAPQWVFRPNSYHDTLQVSELSHITWQYLVDDPEGDKVTYELLESDFPSDIQFSQTSDLGAEISFRTDINSSGKYTIPVSVMDSYGNNVIDSIYVRINDVNRAPVFNLDYEIITLNMAATDPVAVVDPLKMFSDPDGDDFQLLAGNYTPEIIDLAFGNTYVDIHPLKEGTGYLVFGADDGNEEGFTLAEVYVIVLNDPDHVSANPDGFGYEKLELGEDQNMLIYPNPVSNGSVHIVYKGIEDTEVEIRIYNMQGTEVQREHQEIAQTGIYQSIVNMDSYSGGVYLCQIIQDGKVIESRKLIVQ